MAKIKDSNLVTYSPDLKILDCTLRDGGLVNNFYFSDEFVKDLYKTCVAAGIDYMEFGYKASTDIFNESDFGKWKFCKDDDIREIVGDNDTDLKISVMADVGRTNHKRDIINKADSPIDLIRVATYINTIPAAIEIIEDAKKKGYETSCNIMAVSKVNNDDLINGLKEIAKSNVDVIYVVDSFGSYYPEQIARLADMYGEIGEKHNKKIGIHAHNNQQLAFANTITALMHDTKFLDSTISGMGRGAGNCFTESLLGFLKNPNYNIVPVMNFVQKHMLKLKAEGNVWGYDLPYLLTGILNAHPSSAIKFIKENREDYSKYYQELLDDTL
ncbi:MAG: aldolase catalytic domain-containing protein [Acutalibacteraceae bacterium]|nr:aldolase catalytic domain-containing protein [Acutalibacteraceae bacterium]